MGINHSNNREKTGEKRASERETMPERYDDDPSQKKCRFTIFTTLVDSFLIFMANFRVFIFIFILTIFPLSLLLFSLSLSSHPTRTRIFHLESLALLAHTRFEARHLWKLSRSDAVSLLYRKALYFLPCFTLSFISSAAAVSTTATAVSGKRATVGGAVAAVRTTWKRFLATSVCVYVIMMAYVHAQRMLVVVLGGVCQEFVPDVVGLVVEVYVVAVMSMGMVVTVVEDRVGFDAIRAGMEIMEGKRLVGWCLSGLFVLVSGIISWELEEYMKGQELIDGERTVVMRCSQMRCLGENMGRVCGFGLVVLWSYIVTTVFYWECKRRHVIRQEINGV